MRDLHAALPRPGEAPFPLLLLVYYFADQQSSKKQNNAPVPKGEGLLKVTIQLSEFLTHPSGATEKCMACMRARTIY